MPQPQGSLTRLRFKQTLNWPASKPIAVKELLKRLDSLHEELKGHEQEEIQKDSLKKVANELASTQLLNHKESSVKALAACCLVDVLRLCAPDAPFTGTQLKDVYTLLVTQIIPALEDQNDPFHHQHLYVLESLAQVKSILLLPDVQNHASLMRTLFAKCFDILSRSKEEVTKNIEFNITTLLECLIDEATSIPQECVDIILAQFLRADPKAARLFAGKKTQKDPNSSVADMPPSYSVAKNLCNTCSVQMSRYVSQYFSSVIMEAASLDGSLKHRANASRKRKSMDDDLEVPQGPSEEDLKELRKIHGLLRELWKSAPAVLQNVIPQIDSELTTEDEHLRMLATEAIGDMVSGIGAAGLPTAATFDPAVYPSQDVELQQESFARIPEAFARSHASTYQHFLGRQKDKLAAIRAAWTTGIGRILVTRAGGIGLDPNEEDGLITSLSEMLEDTDERVRIAAIQAIALFDVNDVVARLGAVGGFDTQDSLLCRLGQRVREKKHAVRVEAAKLLGRLWASAASRITENEQIKDLLGPIPSKIFEAFYVNDRDIHHMIDEVLFEYFMPLSYPNIKKSDHNQNNGGSEPTSTPKRGTRTRNTAEDADWLRVERLLTLVYGMDTRAKAVVFKLFTRPVSFVDYVRVFIQRCEDWNGGAPDKKKHKKEDLQSHLNKLVQYFASLTPDQSRAAEDFWKFIKTHDRRTYRLITFCSAPDSDYRKVTNALKELRKRVHGMSAANASATFEDTIMSFAHRTANLFYNKSHIQPIMRISQTNEKGLGSSAHDVMMDLASKNPAVFKTHADEMCATIQEQAPSASQSNDPSAIDALKACATFAKKYPDAIPKDRKFQQAMIQYASRGSPPAVAKYAVSTLMAAGENRSSHARELLKKSIELYEYGSDNSMTKLACLSQLMLSSGRDLEDDLDPVVEIALDQTLMKNRDSASESAADDYEWSDEISDECQSKIWALKILANRVRSYDSAEAVRDLAKPVYQLLNILVAKKGDISKRTKTPGAQKSRLRLQAALLLLKLSTNKSYDVFVTPSHFNQLALVAQDELSQVRDVFVRKAKKYLGQERLSSRFYVVPLLLAFEPSARLKRECETWLKARAHYVSKSTSRMVFEVVFARFLSLLAHHPDFTASPQDLEPFTAYIMFYLKNIATEDNLGVIYHVAQRVKSVQDGIDADNSDNLYILSDLAQAMIRSYEDANSWSMQAFAGKIQMPAGIFASLPDHMRAQEIATKTYLPAELAEKVGDIVTSSLKMKNKKRKSATEGDASRPTKTRKIANTGTSSKSTKPNIKKEPKLSKNKRRGEFSDEDEDDDAARTSPAAASSASRRRSGRNGTTKSYAEKADSEDDADMQTWDQATESRKVKSRAPEDDDEEDEADEDVDMEADDGGEEEGAADVSDAGDAMDVDRSRKQSEVNEEDARSEAHADEFDVPGNDSEKENSSRKTRGKKTAPAEKKGKKDAAPPVAARSTRARRR